MSTQHAISVLFNLPVAPDGATQLTAADVQSTRPGLILVAPAAAIGRIDPQLFMPDEPVGPVRVSWLNVVQPGVGAAGSALEIVTPAFNVTEQLADLAAAAAVNATNPGLAGIVPVGGFLQLTSDQINIEMLLVLQHVEQDALVA